MFVFLNDYYLHLFQILFAKWMRICECNRAKCRKIKQNRMKWMDNNCLISFIKCPFAITFYNQLFICICKCYRLFLVPDFNFTQWQIMNYALDGADTFCLHTRLRIADAECIEKWFSIREINQPGETQWQIETQCLCVCVCQCVFHFRLIHARQIAKWSTHHFWNIPPAPKSETSWSRRSAKWAPNENHSC